MRVLIADDEKKICSLINHLVDWESLGMEVIGFAHDGVESCRMINELLPDLVITDIRMPGFNGLEVIKEIKAQHPHIQFIIISGFKQFDYALEALQSGVVNYLLKPINQTELLYTLNKIKEHYIEQNESSVKVKKLEVANEENRKRARKQWLLDLINENSSEVIDIEVVNERFSFDFRAGFFNIAILKIDGISNKELSSKHFKNKVGWLLRTQMVHCYDFEHTFYAGKFIVLFNYESEFNAIRQSLVNVLEALQDEDIFKGYSVTIGLGTCEVNPENIYNSYKIALTNVYERLNLGTNKLISDGVLAETTYDDTQKQFNKLFINAIEFNDMDKLYDALSFLKENFFVSANYSGSTILSVTKEVFNLYILALSKFSLGFDFGSDVSKSFFDEIENIAPKTNVFNYLESTIIKMFQDSLDEKNNRDSKPIAKAKKYISQNFATGITLEDVAYEVGFSSAYFSTLFKNKTGETFSGYLFNIRMEEAKRQLRETQNTVVVICESVGYFDIKHFTKGFKKHTGLKPKEYRKLYS